MNILKAACLIILLTAGAAAQVASSTSGPNDVAVIKIAWRAVERNPKLDEAPPIGNPEAAGRIAVNQARINEANDARTNNPGQPTAPVLLDVPRGPDSPPIVRRWAGFIYEFTVKNTGSKIIRKLVWEYSFTDPATQQVVGRREYKSSKKIRSGETAKLTVRSASPPIGVVSATQDPKSHDLSPDQMVIQRIEYSDGSVWVRN